VESGLGGESATIKSHHNVGGLPDYVDFKEIVEPLRDLFKDEVRQAPMAFASMAAHTLESTPPERAHSTLPLPIFSRRAFTLCSTKESIFQVPAQPQTL